MFKKRLQCAVLFLLTEIGFGACAKMRDPNPGKTSTHIFEQNTGPRLTPGIRAIDTPGFSAANSAYELSNGNILFLGNRTCFLFAQETFVQIAALDMQPFPDCYAAEFAKVLTLSNGNFVFLYRSLHDSNKFLHQILFDGRNGLPIKADFASSLVSPETFQQEIPPVLTNGNLLYEDFIAGKIFIFDGTTGELIKTLMGPEYAGLQMQDVWPLAHGVFAYSQHRGSASETGIVRIFDSAGAQLFEQRGQAHADDFGDIVSEHVYLPQIKGKDDNDLVPIIHDTSRIGACKREVTFFSLRQNAAVKSYAWRGCPESEPYVALVSLGAGQPLILAAGGPVDATPGESLHYSMFVSDQNAQVLGNVDAPDRPFNIFPLADGAALYASTFSEIDGPRRVELIAYDTFGGALRSSGVLASLDPDRAISVDQPRLHTLDYTVLTAKTGGAFFVYNAQVHFLFVKRPGVPLAYSNLFPDFAFSQSNARTIWALNNGNFIEADNNAAEQITGTGKIIARPNFTVAGFGMPLANGNFLYNSYDADRSSYYPKIFLYTP